MILMHADRDTRVKLNRGFDQMAKNDVIGKLARPATGLHDDWAFDLRRSLHDRQHLFHVVHIEGRQAVVILRRVVEQFPQ